MGSTTSRASLPYPVLTDPPNVPSDMQSLATQLDGQTTLLLYENTFSSPPPSGKFTINSIPQTCRDLKIVANLKDTITSGTYFPWALQFNGDSGLNYAYHRISAPATGSPATSGAVNASNTALGLMAATSNTGASVPAIFQGGAVVDIPNYQSNVLKIGTFKYFVWATASNWESGSGGFGWSSTSPITSITLIPNGGTGIAAGSSVRIYGIG